VDSGGRRRSLGLAVLGQFRVIYGSVRQQHRKVEQACGITGAQLWLLHELRRDATIGVSDLAVRLSIHQSTCSQLIDKLVRRRLLTRNSVPGDKRRVRLALTRQARRCLRDGPKPAEGVLPTALLAMPDPSLRALYLQLGKLIAQLGKTDPRYRTQPLSAL
jgi:DNA-binding MarR family transcriptional regulator